MRIKMTPFQQREMARDLDPACGRIEPTGKWKADLVVLDPDAVVEHIASRKAVWDAMARTAPTEQRSGAMSKAASLQQLQDRVMATAGGVLNIER